MSKIPVSLKAGDTVAIVSPSGVVEEQSIIDATEILMSWGFHVVVGQNALQVNGIFAGTDAQRANDMNSAIHDQSVKAIFCSRGGYGMMRIINAIDIDALVLHPKWLVGFSDITVLHSCLSQRGLCSIHGVMPNSFTKTHPDSLTSLRAVLAGDKPFIHIEKHELNMPGRATGQLVGGNLSMLYALRGTPYDIDLRGNILFVEDVGEKLYHLDRMMSNFALGNKFDGLKGVIIGGFNQMTNGSTPYGCEAYDIVRQHVAHLNIPVAFGLDAGHLHRNVAIPLGVVAELEVGRDGAHISF
jgi:muramoyltetrapeptide carboxypeptidase